MSEIDCKSSEFCDCGDIDDRDNCFVCEHYRFIDSGYGWCIFLPTPKVVPWCRVPCGNFKLEVKQGGS